MLNFIVSSGCDAFPGRDSHEIAGQPHWPMLNRTPVAFMVLILLWKQQPGSLAMQQEPISAQPPLTTLADPCRHA